MREALIVWGGWGGHQPEACAAIVADMLGAHGFRVYVEDTTEAFADPALDRMSLIVPILTMSKIEKEEIEGLTSAVKAGVGLGGFHGGMGDALRESLEYNFMVGGQLVAHRNVGREEMVLDPEAAVDQLGAVAQEITGRELLRVYWYDAAPRNSATQHREVAEIHDLKLRLGHLNSAGQQKGVDALIITDMMKVMMLRNAGTVTSRKTWNPFAPSTRAAP